MATKGNATTTSTKATKVPTAKDNAKKPSEVKGDAPKSTAAGQAAAPTSTVSGNATPMDETVKNAKLGGQTVEELSPDPEPADPADTPGQPSEVLEPKGKGGIDGGMRVDPQLPMLVGNHYTARITLDFDPDANDSIVFIHPAGWDVKAAVHGREVSGTFLVERPRSMTFGFRVNGKKVAEQTMEPATS
jgi:hypothetical protein